MMLSRHDRTMLAITAAVVLFGLLGASWGRRMQVLRERRDEVRTLEDRLFLQRELIAARDPFVGPEGVRRLFCGIYDIPEYEGIMLIHYLCNPYIEVAKDGKTARGLWWSPGIETVKRDAYSDPEAVWCFGAYANDFILEHGVWKIWHMRWFLVSKCPYAEGWADQRTYYHTDAKRFHETNAEKSHNPYSKTYIQEAIPMGPLPYDTWNDERWYLRRETKEE